MIVLQTTTFSSYGGIQTYNRLLCRALNDLAAVSPKYVLIGTDSRADAESQRRSKFYNRLQLEAFDSSRARLIRRVSRLVAHRQVDLMLIGHVNYAPLGWLLRRIQPRLRYGVIMHGKDVWVNLPVVRRRALQRADFIVSVSEDTKQRAAAVNGPLPARTYMLPNALQWDGGEDADPLINVTVPPGTKLLSVCRLASNERQKGVDTVIEALPGILTRVPDVQYLVVGDGTDLARHKALARKLGVANRVHFLGFVDDNALRLYYQSCDIFVMPSAQEGFGIVFLEAMQYGKAVVAADYGGVPEVVQDGVTGTLVQYGNVSQLAQAIADLCLNVELRAQLGRAGYDRLQENFTYPQFKKRLADILARELPPAAVYRARRREIAGEVQPV